MTDIDKLKIPLIVGVSGHIDITTPESVLQDALTEFWTQLHQTIGPETPIVLLSSIARGADHLMVKYRPADVNYCAVLPFDSNEYAKDFTGQALDDYRADLAGAFKCITCGADAGDYTLASDYVRTHSDILVTFWDGYETLDRYGLPQKGGTYFLLRKTFQLDDLLISQPEKAHITVNIPVERQKVHPEYEKQLLSEKKWGTLIWNANENPQITPGLSLNEHPKFADNIAFIQRHNSSLPDKVEKKTDIL